MIRYHQVVGLDIGSTTVRAVLAARRLGSPLLIDAAERVLPRDGTRVAETVRGLLEEEGWLRMPCVIGLPSDKLVIRSLPLDHRDPRSERQVMDLEAEPYVDGAADGTIMDHVRMDGHTPPHLIFAVTRTDTVEQTLSDIVRRGITVVDLVPNAVALYNAMIRHRELADGRIVCAELGHRGVELVVGTRKCLLHARRIESAAVFPDAGTGDEPHAGPQDRDVVVACAAQWADEINEALALFYSESTEPATESATLVVCGPGAGLPGVPEELAQRTDMRTACWEHEYAPSDRAMWPQAVASGLALCRVDGRGLSMSLLPPERKEAMTLRWQIKYWTLAAGFALAAFVLVVLSARMRLAPLQAAVDARETRLEQLVNLQASVAGLREDIVVLQKQVRPLRIALHNGAALESVIAALAGAKHPDDWITLIADADTYFQFDEKDEDHPAPWLPASPSLLIENIIVEGYTPVEDLHILEETIDALREHPAILAADLVPDDRVRVDLERDARWAAYGSQLFAIQITTALHPSLAPDEIEGPPVAAATSGARP